MKPELRTNEVTKKYVDVTKNLNQMKYRRELDWK